MDSLKAWLIATIGLSQDSLHTYMGFVLFFGAALLLRKPPSHPLPWLIVAVLALLKEAWDIHSAQMAGSEWSAFKASVDVLSIVFWPTVIMLMVRHGIVFRRQ